MKKTIHALSAGIILTTSAHAGDVSPMVIMPNSVSDWSWSGFYVGGQVGLGFEPSNDGTLEFDSNLDGVFGDTVPFGAGAGNGAFGRNFDHDFEEDFTYGLHAGYDRQLNNKWVVGAVLDYNITDLKESQSGFSGTPAFYHEERTIDDFGSLRFRLGYLVTPRTMLFASAGVSYTSVDYNFNSNNPNGTSSGGQDSNWGYVFGAGVETRLNQNWSLTFEYLYTNTGGSDFTTSFDNGPFATAAGSTNVRGSEDDFDFYTIQMKLSYRF